MAFLIKSLARTHVYVFMFVYGSLFYYYFVNQNDPLVHHQNCCF